MKLGRPSELRTASISETDTSSTRWSDAGKGGVCAVKAAALLFFCRIFEAGESDIGHTDAAAVNSATASSGAAQHRAPITAVRVASFSSAANAQDVADFLEGVELRRGLDSVVLLGDQGTDSSAAIVELADETAQRVALGRNNQLFGNARVQVFPLTASEIAIFAQASAQGFSLQDASATQQQLADMAQQQPAAVRPQQTPPTAFSADGSTLKLRGLPYSASVADILEFFEGAATDLSTTSYRQIAVFTVVIHICTACQIAPRFTYMPDRDPRL